MLDLFSFPLRLRAVRYAPVLGQHSFGLLLAALFAVLAALMAQAGEPKPLAQWRAVDLLSEGGLCLMLGVWLAQLRASRPAGPVTDLLAVGLGAWLLGAGVDVLDEVLQLPKGLWWDNLLESGLAFIGMAALTWGLHAWRQEQLLFNEQQQRRERGLRDHRRQDPATQLADADFMAAQIETERRAGADAWLLMLGFDGFERLLREAGLAEADRLLLNAGQLLCLNLGADELVCRYGGDRFVLLLRDASAAESLRAALAALSHADAQGRRWQLPVRAAGCAVNATGTPAALMLRLAHRLA